MRNRYPGSCLRCAAPVAAGEGYFQRDKGRWLVRCVACVGMGNEPVEMQRGRSGHEGCACQEPPDAVFTSSGGGARLHPPAEAGE